MKSNLEETISTLNFAYEIKKIKNNVKRNEELSVNNAKIMEEKFLNLQNNYKLIFSQYEESQKKYQNQENIIQEKERLSKNMEKQNGDLNIMMADIMEKEQELKKFKEENEELKDKINKNDIAIKIMDDEIKNLNEENFRLKSKVENLEEEIKSLRENLCEKNKSNRKIEKMNNQLQKEYELLKNKYDSSKISIDEYLEKISSLNQQNIILEKEKKEILIQKEQFEKKIIELKKYFSDLLNNNNFLNGAIYLHGDEYGFNLVKRDLNNYVDGFEKCFRYYCNENMGFPTSHLNLDDASKKLIDIHGLDALMLIFRDEVRKNLEEFCKLSDELVSERKFLIRYLGEQKEILVNNIKSNFLE